MKLLKQAWPWLVGAAILVVIISRVPFASLSDAITHGPHWRLAPIEVASTLLVLCSDSFSTWAGLIGARMRRPLRQVLIVRGATYLLFLLNYALGQGAFGYYLHRTGEQPARAAGATLFLIGTNLATLLTLTGLGVLIVRPDEPTLTMIVAIGCGGFAAYLGVIALAPRFLARIPLLSPLFDAGLRGHGLAVLGRVPHVSIVILGHWVAMRAWGLPVPFATGILLMPAVAIATVLPISPAGLGTTQAAIAYFFRDFAPGATADDRTAALLAFGVVHFVYGMIASLAVGLVCFPLARRAGALQKAAA